MNDTDETHKNLYFNPLTAKPSCKQVHYYYH